MQPTLGLLPLLETYQQSQHGDHINTTVVLSSKQGTNERSRGLCAPVSHSGTSTVARLTVARMTRFLFKLYTSKIDFVLLRRSDSVML